MKVLLLISYGLMLFAIIKSHHDSLKLIDSLMNELDKEYSRELELLRQRNEIMKIILNAKLNKEYHFETVEKIKKVLFAQKQTAEADSEIKDNISQK